MLALMLADPQRLTSADADRWARQLDSWDLCDGFAYDLMSRTRFRWKKPAVWTRSRHEFVRRAGYALIAGLAVHDREAPDERFIDVLPLVVAGATDSRNFVRKAVNWALRQIGKRNRHLNRAAIACAGQVARLDAPSARWVASDALRELRSPAVQQRLARASSRRA